MPPDGRVLRLSARTIEAWYYLHKHGGFEALSPDARADRGRSRAIRAELAEVIARAKREKPRRSVRRIIRMPERAGLVKRGELARARASLARRGGDLGTTGARPGSRAPELSRRARR
jgi:hypothetical protein